jgi:hypothetical protein
MELMVMWLAAGMTVGLFVNLAIDRIREHT